MHPWGLGAIEIRLDLKNIMTTYVIQGAAEPSHLTRKNDADVVVDGTPVAVRVLRPNVFAVQSSSHAMKLHAAAHGDSVYVQLNGRACRIDRVDPKRSNGGASADGGGVSLAPMPGVVVSWLMRPGSLVKVGAPLLVIESMKLQMTIEATQDGVLEDLPFNEGQTFQRGATLARVRPDSPTGASV
jgi:3-methylcrotonyl-CoA carboxylase alpha subunit